MIESDNRILKIEKWIVPPRKIFKVPFTGSWFYLSAKFDKTTIERFIEALAWSFFVSPIIPLLIEVGKFRATGRGNDNCMGLKDGKHFPKSACKQGANVIDFFGTLIGIKVFFLIT